MDTCLVTMPTAVSSKVWNGQNYAHTSSLQAVMETPPELTARAHKAEKYGSVLTTEPYECVLTTEPYGSVLTTEPYGSVLTTEPYGSVRNSADPYGFL